ncbi:MAG: hypothetical protein JWO75_5628 [Actinomycetia bacterium]|nr:hypothetical protein [Actinomycetes bacterium]
MQRTPPALASAPLAESGSPSRLAVPDRLSLTRTPSPGNKEKVEANMRLGSVILVVWLIIGLIATAQRGYFNDRVSCASAGTVIVTILAGPLNFVGVNPKLSCH